MTWVCAILIVINQLIGIAFNLLCSFNVYITIYAMTKFDSLHDITSIYIRAETLLTLALINFLINLNTVNNPVCWDLQYSIYFVLSFAWCVCDITCIVCESSRCCVLCLEDKEARRSYTKWPSISLSIFYCLKVLAGRDNVCWCWIVFWILKTRLWVVHSIVVFIGIVDTLWVGLSIIYCPHTADNNL